VRILLHPYLHPLAAHASRPRRHGPRRHPRRGRVKRRATIAVAIIGVVLFVYFRPLTLAHAAAHILVWRAGMHAHTAEVNGPRTRYFEGGAGPPLLLIHGLGSS